MSRSAHVLIIVQNLPVPLDRRVWLECLALRGAGYEVSVICPQGPGDPLRQVIDGVHIYKYRPPPTADGLAGYVLEFAYCWLSTAWLSTRVWRRKPFDVVQACNPPDTYWLLARLWRGRGVRFVFDHHDLNPELFLSRFGSPRSLRERLEYRALLWLERRTFRSADRVISTNESYKAIAVRRGGRRPDEVTVVRSGPDTREMRPQYPATGKQKPSRFSLVYLGVMGPQDGVEVILDVMEELVHKRGRTDVHANLLGFGDCLEDLRDRTTELGLDDVVTFTGRADKAMVAQYLSAADVGLCPDLGTPLNDVSTMNKTMEYMAYALPSVSFDLTETRVSGGDSVLYVPSGDVAGFADAVERLLDDDQLRLRMALLARERVSTQLDWRPQAAAYLSVYEELFGHVTPRVPAQRVSTESPGGSGNGTHASNGGHGSPVYVDLEDRAELERFILERTAPPTAKRTVPRQPYPHGRDLPQDWVIPR